RARRLVRAFHLPLDLSLAQDHRVQARYDPEQVLHAPPVAVDVQGPPRLRFRQIRACGEQRHGLALPLSSNLAQIQFCPVARREQDRFPRDTPPQQVQQGRFGVLRPEYETLAHLNGCGAVAQTYDRNRHDRTPSPTRSPPPRSAPPSSPAPRTAGSHAPAATRRRVRAAPPRS